MSAGVIGRVKAHGRSLVLVRDDARVLSLHLDLGPPAGSHLVSRLTRAEAAELVGLLQAGLGLTPTRPEDAPAEPSAPSPSDAPGERGKGA